MTSSNDFKTGMSIQYEGNLYTIIEFLHVKPGKGSAFVRSKLRNLRTGAVIDKTFKAGEKMPKAHIDKEKMQYLYHDGVNLVFMNNETYEQVEIPEEKLAYEKNFMYETIEVVVISFEGELLGVELPDKITLEVTQADPAVKGNTATNATKEVEVSTGYRLHVPMFIEEGQNIIISTKDGKYSSKA